jgi:ribonucleoside-triphosphate reductase
LNPFKTDLQQVQFADKYARWDDQLKRRETWEETTDRVIGFLEQRMKRHLKENNNLPSPINFMILRSAMLNLDVLPSMRVIQMAGPTLERCNVGAYNCSYLPLQDWRSFSELLYILMQGTGVGFSVEQRYIDQLPTIKPQGGSLPHHFSIEDSTEGWCNALGYGLDVWASGGDVIYDYSKIRPYGAPLKTKGGKASGPQPLRDLLDFARKLIFNHQGRKLSSLNAHDLACYCGSIVQVGGVRRAAEISLSDLHDDKMRGAKQGQFWLKAPERAMANNSAVYNQKPSTSEFVREWTELMNSGTGERGIFNREGTLKAMPERRKQDVMGLNPCGEIVLRPFEFCNLSIAVARSDDNIYTLKKKVQLATQFGIVQSLLTDFNYIRPDWKKNCEEERLLGVDITGQMDCMLLWGNQRAEHYHTLKTVAVDEAKSLAHLLNINCPAAVTCVKPSGNSSQLLNVSSGLHPRYAEHYIRRLRIGASSPVAQLLIDANVPRHPENGQNPDSPTVWVFEFPVQSPIGAMTRNEMTAIDQLQQWKVCKQNFTEHNPSITVYVREDEWLEVGAWVFRNWDCVGGISFLPFDGGIYQLAPYEEITKEEYDRRITEWPRIDFTKLQSYERADTTELNRDYACVGDKCEI